MARQGPKNCVLWCASWRRKVGSVNVFMTEMLGSALDTTAPAGAQGSPGAGTVAGAVFAAQLGQAMDRLGQDGVPTGGLVPGLQATALSADWQILTPEQATLDPQALAEFAKSQGIDDAAVRWLFQQGVAVRGDGAELLQGAPGPGAGSDAEVQDGPAAVAPLPEGEHVAFMAMGAPALAWRHASMAAPATTDATAGALAPAPLKRSELSVAPAAALSGGSVEADVPPAEDAITALAALAAWTSERWDGAVRVARPDASAAQSEQAVGLSQVAKAPRPELAALLQKMVAADAGQRKAPQHMDVLELDADLQADLSQWLDDGSADTTMVDSPRPAAASAAGALAPQLAPVAAKGEGLAPPPPASNAAERADQLQALAQRVGQAVGQRLVSMIERGHWNVKFMLKPQQLGEIEVDLRMRSGELDAAFRATNAFTRDLLQDGLPRLREVMSSMGMDVASMHVGNGQAQRHGGNSTPAFKAPKGAPAASVAQAETPTVVRVPRMGSDGLDVMV